MPWHWPQWVWFVIAPVMLFGYPLSIGPVAYLTVNEYFSDETIRALTVFYWPLLNACGKTEVTEEALNRYCNWWVNLEI